MIDSLIGLRPLHEPPPVSWWPPAAGWWLLALCILLLLLAWWRRYLRSAPQRAALRELALLAADGSAGPAAINRLVKRYALVCWPDAPVAAISGREWLAFLDRHGGNGEFAQGPGLVLLDAPYRRDTGHSPELVPLVRRWIKYNRPGANR